MQGPSPPPYKPEFSPADLDEMIAAINAAKADVLWVGMTAPKLEKWIHQNRHRLQVKFIGAIGAVFDFYTGRVKRSHPLGPRGSVFQKIGLEWLLRLLQEPPPPLAPHGRIRAAVCVGCGGLETVRGWE